MASNDDICYACKHKRRKHTGKWDGGDQHCTAIVCPCPSFTEQPSEEELIEYEKRKSIWRANMKALSETRVFRTSFAPHLSDVPDETLRDVAIGKLSINDARKSLGLQPRKEYGMRMTANTTGSGKLTVRMLKDILEEGSIPEDATLKIEMGNDQKDGSYWSVCAEWGAPAQERHPYTTGQFPIVHRNADAPKDTQFGDH